MRPDHSRAAVPWIIGPLRWRELSAVRLFKQQNLQRHMTLYQNYQMDMKALLVSEGSDYQGDKDNA